MRFFTFLFLLMMAGGCGGGSDDGPPADQTAVQVTLTHAFSHAPAAPGQTLQILWRFDLAEDWHLYGPGLNDSGFPPSVTLDLPDGWSAGPLRWPAPERYLMAGGILDHVYHGQLLVVQDLLVPLDAEPASQVAIPAQVNWLACKDACVPGQAKLTLVIDLADRARPTADLPLITKTLAAVPLPAPAGALSVVWSESHAELTVPGAARLAFYPDTDCLPLQDLVADGLREGETLLLRVAEPKPGQERLKGILHQQLEDGTPRNWTIDFQPGG